MDGDETAARLRRLHRIGVLGVEVALADRFVARLLGLAWLDRGEVGAGLLIPRCRSVHTFGMRFPLDLIFLDAHGAPLAVRRHVPRCRLVREPRADAVLEVPAQKGGEFSALGT